MGDRTRKALERFQAREGLTVTGELDDASAVRLWHA
jgi:hypothetical protein